jgi:hypothetical protein
LSTFNFLKRPIFNGFESRVFYLCRHGVQH